MVKQSMNFAAGSSFQEENSGTFALGLVENKSIVGSTKTLHILLKISTLKDHSNSS